MHKIHQNDLASMAGVARESVSRTVSDWKRQDIIRMSLPNHYVLHKETLQREATDPLQ
ncbi:MAG: helix-turn-helix domain-containing protein [Reyranella sp.]|nr:helix-turn-helix domain-containing protein [Reyranella sp.]